MPVFMSVFVSVSVSVYIVKSQTEAHANPVDTYEFHMQPLKTRMTST